MSVIGSNAKTLVIETVAILSSTHNRRNLAGLRGAWKIDTSIGSTDHMLGPGGSVTLTCIPNVILLATESDHIKVRVVNCGQGVTFSLSQIMVLTSPIECITILNSNCDVDGPVQRVRVIYG